MSRFFGSGRWALAHSELIFPGVSAPSKVVKSMQLTANCRAAALELVLIERVAKPAARPSSPTASTGVVVQLPAGSPLNSGELVDSGEPVNSGKSVEFLICVACLGFCLKDDRLTQIF